MEIHFRQESPGDYRAVEELTRDAFWKFWEDDRTVCDEHLLVHKLRTVSALVPELNLVAEHNGQIVGHIIYTTSKVVDATGNEHEVLTFGPVSVLPAFQNQRLGRRLIAHSLDVAKLLGYRAVVIYGHPNYYPRVGFRPAADFGITTKDGHAFDAFMAYPLYEGALSGISGKHIYDPVYESLTQEEALEFDNQFPHKEPYKTTPISVLLDQLSSGARKAVVSLDFPVLEMFTSRSLREISSLKGIDNKALEIIRATLKEHDIRWA